MVFEGIRGKNYQGDIAIDDISYVDGDCGTVPATPSPPAGRAKIEERIIQILYSHDGPVA